MAKATSRSRSGGAVASNRICYKLESFKRLGARSELIRGPAPGCIAGNVLQ